MKHFSTLLVLAILLTGCKQNNEKSEEGSSLKDSTEVGSDKELSLLDEIAYANGYENWSTVDSISYTFNAQNGDNISKRSWQWKPKTGEVTMKTQDTTLTYNNTNFEEEVAFADRGFVNDKYWLLFPYNLVWDENFDHKVAEQVEAPISGELMQEIAIMYNNDSGYTPGDTYHIYVDDNKIIREWTYTPSGSDKPRLATTWEDYEDFKGIKIAKMHDTKEGNFKIFFTDISVN
ncbi:hypothetical protein [Psychroflexus lacisalsi]|jgi:hypothetical protein|uniref:Uncharacterized protein n=1 Tax=Psychroflexus lacisalsi TaxID=503928 RepID=A0ABN1KCG1_9FLAO|nr:hypothetical protein [Psychroflexus lacisalsi]MBZ9620051.1 hypothetical protein [Psychroflexus lacisalsi]